MKILYLTSGTKLHGGATKSLLNLMRFVVGEGHDVILVCPNKEGVYKYIKDGNLPGADAISLDYTYDILPFLDSAKDYALFLPRLLKRVVKNRLAARKLAEYCKANSVDLIHSNTSVNNIGYLAALKLGLPHVWHIREYGKKDFRMIVPFQKKKLNAPRNYVICITKDIMNYKGIRQDSEHRNIYNGIVAGSSLRYNSTPERYFLYAGSVTERKGIIDLLEAYKGYLRNTGENPARLKIAGNIPAHSIDLVSRKLKELGIEEYVELLGPRDDVGDLMYDALAVIVPSKFEGFGRVMPEAMANGALVIGRNTGGTREQLDNGLELKGEEIGLRFESVQDLVDCLVDVDRNGKEAYRTMIEKSQEVVQSLYSNEEYGRRVNEFYCFILNNLYFQNGI